MSTATPAEPAVHYPDSDGQPIADNTRQFEWIGTVMWNLDALFRDRPDVFVAGDHLIYPVAGDDKTRAAPDVYVAFGRPKGHRGSYRVFEEDGVFPQVVFEVWSPGNRAGEMEKRREFYERYGAEEYYILYPDPPCEVEAWHRTAAGLTPVAKPNGLVSPRLGVRFGFSAGELRVTGPDGRPFRSPTDIAAERDAERQRADEERRRADAERQRADESKCRADRLADKLRRLGVDPDVG